MLGLQFCIGATNDVVDARLDTAATSRGSRSRPASISAGAPRCDRCLAAASIGARHCRQRRPAGRTAGAADARLRPGVRPRASSRPSLGFGLLLARFRAAAGLCLVRRRRQLPPRLELLLPIAAVAGPALQLSNGLVDIERDRAGGIATLATRLGPASLPSSSAPCCWRSSTRLAWLSLAASARVGRSRRCRWPSPLAVVGVALSSRQQSIAARDRLGAPGSF